MTAPEIEGYTFLGWALNGTPYSELTDALLTELNESGHKLILNAVYIPDNFIFGDVDIDGNVLIFDATYIQRYLVNLPNKSFNEAAADVDGDGKITILDVTYIQRWLVGLDDGYPIGMPIEST